MELPPQIDTLDKLVGKRRRALVDPELFQTDKGKWGLALSGGGIRSATFALGLVTSMARKKMFLRFDYMSTVSGGGYIGATIGRLFDLAQPKGVRSDGSAARAVEDGLGSERATWTTWWLRANGRYLIPSGILDFTLIAALYARNVIAVHFELALLALAAGIVMACINVGVWSGVAALGWGAGFAFFESVRWLAPWLPVSWLLLIPLGFLAAIQTAAFWSFPYIRRIREAGGTLAFVMAALVIGVLLHPLYGVLVEGKGSDERASLWLTMLALMVCWVIGACYSRLVWNRASATFSEITSAAAEVRSILTQRLSTTFRWSVIVVVVGAIERFAWHLAFEPSFLDVAAVGVGLALVAPALRASLPILFSVRPGATGTRLLWAVGRLLGYAIMVLLGAFWMSIAYRAVLGAYSADGASAAVSQAMTIAIMFLIPIATYLMSTGRNLEFLNLSSLHSFYRARLVRSYLGAANAKRFNTSAHACMGAIEPLPPRQSPHKFLNDIDAVHLDDDVSMSAYCPTRSGGPIHLITMCANQTRDPRGGIFNRDRQGLPLTVASGGYMRQGAEPWTKLNEYAPLSLGTFIAISGAAVAPAAGALTRGGIAALAMFAGVRLGYWWSHERREGKERDPKSQFARQPLMWMHACTGKSRRVIDELLGHFKGTRGPDWFLTDGGHFENTGAYALLAEGCKVIVVSDASADPKYAFQDLENLVRKARIDLNTDIRFMRPRPRQDVRGEPPLPGFGHFGTIDDLASSQSNASMALATITYANDPDNCGILVYVKPNFFIGLPVDLVNFKAANPSFPQEPTSDQFFSESQWESYFLLGKEMGQVLSVELLTQFAKDPKDYFVEDVNTTLDGAISRAKIASTEPTASPAPTASRIPSRIAVSTVKATVGLTAVAAIGASVWQAGEGLRAAYSKGQETENADMANLASLWSDTRHIFQPTDPLLVPPVARLATALLIANERHCKNEQVSWIATSTIGQSIVSDIIADCTALADLAPRACAVLLYSAGPQPKLDANSCIALLTSNGVPSSKHTYWGYDYTATRHPVLWHPCDLRRNDPDAARYWKISATEVESPIGCAHVESPGGMTPLRSALASITAVTNNFIGTTWNALAIPSSSETFEPQADVAFRAPADAGISADESSSSFARQRPTSDSALRSLASAACQNVTVFIQVYDNESKVSAEKLKTLWRTLGAKVPAVDNVLEAAEKRSRTLPKPVTESTVRYHRDDAAACAGYLWPTASEVLTLPGPVTPRLLGSRFQSSPMTIEVWLPLRTRVAARTAGPVRPSAVAPD